MSVRARQIAGGISIAAVLLLSVAAMMGKLHIEAAYHHVEVLVFNQDDRAFVEVDCRPVRVPLTGEEPVSRLDLGFLRLDDNVMLSDRNLTGGAAWGFKVFSDGRQVFESEPGNAGADGAEASPNAFVMAVEVNSAGKELGNHGCVNQTLVSSQVAEYAQSPEADSVGRDGARPRWEPRLMPFEAVLAAGAAAPWALVVVAILTLFCAKSVRDALYKHRKWLVRIGGPGVIIGVLSKMSPGEAILIVQVVAFLFLGFASALLLRGSARVRS